MNEIINDTLKKITDDIHKKSAQNIFDWLMANKISLSGKYKDKRWGIVKASNDGGWYVHINVQYDEYLDELLSGESEKTKTIVKSQVGHMGCNRCKPGKCQFTGTDIVNPDENQKALNVFIAVNRKKCGSIRRRRCVCGAYVYINKNKI